MEGVASVSWARYGLLTTIVYVAAIIARTSLPQSPDSDERTVDRISGPGTGAGTETRAVRCAAA
jgi:hypothetical protein